MHHRARWVEQMSRSGVSEMAWFVEQLGPQWHNPTIPSDAWRAEYPPEPPSEHP